MDNEYVARMWTVYKFVTNILPQLANTQKALQSLVDYLTPRLTACSTFVCERGKLAPKSATHHERLVQIVLWKFISPILTNYCDINSDQMKLPDTIQTNKKDNRKFLTFSRVKKNQPVAGSSKSNKL